jgi:hypothetical protein
MSMKATLCKNKPGTCCPGWVALKAKQFQAIIDLASALPRRQKTV